MAWHYETDAAARHRASGSILDRKPTQAAVDAQLSPGDGNSDVDCQRCLSSADGARDRKKHRIASRRPSMPTTAMPESPRLRSPGGRETLDRAAPIDAA